MTAVSSSSFPELSGAHYPLAGLCHIVFLTQTKKRQAAIWLPAGKKKVRMVLFLGYMM